MPKRPEIDSVLIIGSGPIVIGQACEFDYSGTQACKVLREEGIRVILLNSNPATIMTDPELVDRTYVEPINVKVLEQIVAAERPSACLPTLGGQTALNVAVAAAEAGIFEHYGVELIGASVASIRTAEDRRIFRQAMLDVGLDLPASGFAYSVDEACAVAQRIGLPVVIRASFTLGGGGSGIARTIEDVAQIAAEGIELSAISEVLIEESIEGWKEFELEVMRDRKDNFVVVCSVENFDPMGVHTGDSITVAPTQTLTDREFQIMREAAKQVIRRVGVETGGSNIQFAINPTDGRMVVIEMNPRVSRSSALASKATGFPIAKMAARLSLGYTLDEIPNDITAKTPASFEPSIDYVVVKIPRWTFEKFPDADPALGTRMKSVGEVMAIGRTFPEALQKAMRSLETGLLGLSSPTVNGPLEGDGPRKLVESIRKPTEQRLPMLGEALRRGATVEDIADATSIDPWFLAQIEQIVIAEKGLRSAPELSAVHLKKAKRLGFSDHQIGALRGLHESKVREQRIAAGVVPTYKTVDTCAAEFEALTPYFYSTYEDEDEKPASSNKSIVILGSGPNRIGQGIEFDYCCVHAAMAVKDAGYDAIMINCNPETVSTDYDTSTRLYFEPLTVEDVLNVLEREKPLGVIVSLGGQTPLRLARHLDQAGFKILGTSVDSIDAAEDRERFAVLLDKLGISQAPGGTAMSVAEALEIAKRVGFPVLVRPSYVLGGRAMEIAYNDEMLTKFIHSAASVSPEHPILIDRFLEGAIEVDVDAVFDGEALLIGGIMEHIEEAGIHSGDSACVLPPHSIAPDVISLICDATDKLARALKVRGLINVQYAIRDGKLFCLEVNPRASRTVPFVGKVTGVPLAKVATKVMLGEGLGNMSGLPAKPHSGPWLAMKDLGHFGVKEAVLPFSRFPGVDSILGPEMKSTGEVMGIDHHFGAAFAKAQAGAGYQLPDKGTVFVSVADRDKPGILEPITRLAAAGFQILATSGTARFLADAGIEVVPVKKHSEGSPNIVDEILQGHVDLVINTPLGRGARSDGYSIRTAAVARNVAYVTTLSGLAATVSGIESTMSGLGIKALQDYLGPQTAVNA